MFSSPHSGRAYGAEFLALTRLALPALRRSEDCFIDEIFAATPEQGAALIVADFPRAWCDANREAWELDPGMFDAALPPWVNTTSPRVAAGLGTLARVVSSGEAIYRGKLRFADAQARVDACWMPYHAALAQLMDAARARFGSAVLIDCHSMPAHACQDRRPVPDIVLGDAHGASCAPALLRAVDHWLTRRGYVVRRNDPYAGGYITRHYGRPAERCHALQIELARNLYMDEATLAKSTRFERTCGDMAALTQFLIDEAERLIGPPRSGAV